MAAAAEQFETLALLGIEGAGSQVARHNQHGIVTSCGNQIGHCVQRGEEAGAGGIDVQRGYGCAEGDLFVYQRGGAGNGLHADGGGADDAVQLGGGNARFV